MKDVCRDFQKYSDSDNLLTKTVNEHIVLVDWITFGCQAAEMIFVFRI